MKSVLPGWERLEDSVNVFRGVALELGLPNVSEVATKRSSLWLGGPEVMQVVRMVKHAFRGVE